MHEEIKTLSWFQHIRLRTSWYIGRIGDGSDPRDGVYTLFKEILNNAIDEFRRGYGTLIEVSSDSQMFSVRDYGRGIAPERVKMVLQDYVRIGDVYSYTPDPKSDGIPMTIGLGGYGLKLNVALSSDFLIESYGQKETERFHCARGEVLDSGKKTELSGTLVKVSVDHEIFGENPIRTEIIEEIILTSVRLHKGLTITYSGKTYVSEHGLLDIVEEHLTGSPLYPPIHLEGKGIEVVLTHTDGDGTDILSFVNGHFTKEGGTHSKALKRAATVAINRVLGTDFPADICLKGITGAVSINILNPLFENELKSVLSSIYMDEDDYYMDKDDYERKNKGARKISTSIYEVVVSGLAAYLSDNPEVLDIIRRRLKNRGK